ncbi:MAG: ATP-binding protein [Candidatus Sumerlaeaceae bacterium]
MTEQKPGYKECPACAEWIKEKAKLCRYCGAVLVDETLPRIASREERDLLGDGEALMPGSGGLGDLGEILMMQHRTRLERALRGGEDQYRSATVVFVDLVGYTRLCEHLRPEETKEILDAYYAICGHVVDFFNGFILEFQGDGCLAVFGAPMAYERDAESAVRAALAILERIKAMPEMHGHRVKASAGIETGVVLSSVIRTRTPPIYKVFGNAVNLAARIKGVAKPGALMIGPETYDIVRELFKCKKSGMHEFKNIAKKVMVYEVLSARGPEAQRRDFSVPFVGRERELQKLTDVWVRCFDGRGSDVATYERVSGGESERRVCGVVLEGEPGIGKTRLALEFAQRQAGAVIGHVEGAPYSAKVPWELWRGVLSSLLEGAARNPGESDWKRVERALERLGYSRVDATPILAMLGDPRALDNIQALPPLAAQRLLRTELRALLERIAGRATALVLILDDLQWSDRTSTEALNALLASPPKKTFFMVAYRNEESTDIAQMRALERVRLRGLDLRSRRALFGALADLQDILPEVRERLIHQEAGNPFYMMELARNAARAIAEGIKPASMYAEFDPENPSTSAGELVPPSLLEILQSRIDSLDERRKLVLQCAAVLGKRFSLEFIEFFNFIQEGLLARLYSLKTLQLLDDNITVTGLEFFFLHHITREVSYRTLLVRQRRELHTFIATELERKYADRLAPYAPVLAYHWTQAEDDARSIPYLRMSGDQASGMGAIPDAMEHYEEALKRLHRLAPTPENRKVVATILRARAKLQRLSGEPRRALESLASALDALGKSRDNRLLSRIRLEAGLALQMTGEYDRAQKEFETALPMARKHGDVDVIADLVQGLGLCWWSRGDFGKARELFETALEVDLSEGHPSIAAAVRNNLALVEWKAGELKKAAGLLREALRFQQITGDKFLICATVMNLGILEENLGNSEAAEKHYREALALAERLQYQQVLTATHANLANLFLSQQHGVDAMRHSAAAYEIAEKIEDRRSAAIALENLALSNLILHNPGECRKLVKQANRVAEELGDAERMFSLELVDIEAAIVEKPGNGLAKRLAKAERSLQLFGYEAERPRLLRLTAQHHARTNDPAKAKVAAALALDAARKQNNVPEQGRTRALIQNLK